MIAVIIIISIIIISIIISSIIGVIVIIFIIGIVIIVIIIIVVIIIIICVVVHHLFKMLDLRHSSAALFPGWVKLTLFFLHSDSTFPCYSHKRAPLLLEPLRPSEAAGEGPGPSGG